jgi:multidrug efflux pump subunit AcrA (membrane-fusion protein)
MLPHCWPPETRSSLFRTAAQLVLAVLPATVFWTAACGGPKAAPAIPSPEVEVASVLQKDVPIFSEWVATLDGYVNAQIQPQVAGYVIRQTYKEGSFVRKGQILFQIDPRPLQALLDQAKAQLAQAQAQLGKTEMDVNRDTPLAKERAIAQSQLDNDIQAKEAAKAAVAGIGKVNLPARRGCASPRTNYVSILLASSGTMHRAVQGPRAATTGL